MTGVLYGFFGALLALGLFTAGAVAGWSAHKAVVAHDQTKAVEEATEQERLELLREQEAFTQLMGYSAADAYQISKGE